VEDPGAGGAPMGRTLCITEVVLQESIAHYSRRMDEAVVRLERWRSKHAGGLSVQPLVAEFAQQLLEHAASYAEQLRSALDAIPVEVLPSRKSSTTSSFSAPPAASHRATRRAMDTVTR